MWTESCVVSKHVLGWDVRKNDLTIGKELGRLVCKLKGDVDGEITLTPMGVVRCNIMAGGKLQKIGTVISFLPEVEESIDKVNQTVFEKSKMQLETCKMPLTS